MKTKGFKISSSVKLMLFSSIGTLFITGLVWLVLHNYFLVVSDFSTSPSPFESIFLQIHGAVAPIFLITFGAIISNHISRAYKAKVNLTTGLLLLLFTSFLIATGYFLYYTSNESIRSLSSDAHSLLGIISIPLLLAHIFVGKAIVRKLKN